MTKKIYVKSDTLKEAVDYINDEITFFGFLSNVKGFLKELLINPTTADVNDYLKRHGVERKVLLDELLKRDIVNKETKIEEINGKDKFHISFKIPKHNFERKMKRLYSFLFEKNEIAESVIFEEGGGSNPDAGQFIQPIGKVQRRKIYVTNEQYKMLKEMGTVDAGNYQYDVPFGSDKNDPAFDHKNMIEKGVPHKKKGVRLKNK